MSNKLSYEQMGGKAELRKISKIFYDKVYKHPWLKQYFEKIDQERIESQQVDFMQKVLGGPKRYSGKTPPTAHQHIYITEELFTLRESLLIAAFEEADAHPALREEWLKLEHVFKAKIVRSNPSDCIQRFSHEGIINFPKPH